MALTVLAGSDGWCCVGTQSPNLISTLRQSADGNVSELTFRHGVENGVPALASSGQELLRDAGSIY